jgi:galactitol-specific phosphotransferase system IIB component
VETFGRNGIKSVLLALFTSIKIRAVKLSAPTPMESNMAILIPSKHIYGDIENPKVRNNLIDKVEIKQKIIASENKYDEIVYGEKFVNLVKTPNATDRDKDAGYGLLGSNAYSIAIADIEAISKRTALEVKIPALKDNSFVETLKLGFDENGNSNIGLRL